MRSTFFGLEIGRTGINMGQLGLDVTGHNIANINTRGYTRQRVVQTALDPFNAIGRFAPAAQALVGGGSSVLSHERMRLVHLDRRFRAENTNSAYWNVRTFNLRHIESFFDNVNEETSINFTISRFFEATKTLASDPVSGANRVLLRDAGRDFASQMNIIHHGLMQIQAANDLAVRTLTTQINSKAEQIRVLNIAIFEHELGGQLVANDLRDKRDVLLDDLSQIVEIDFQEVTDNWGFGRMVVTIGGRELVNHNVRHPVGIREEDNVIDGHPPVAIPVWVDADGYPLEMPPIPPGIDPIPIDLRVRGGELGANMEMRDGYAVTSKGVPYYVELLNNMARLMVQEINAQHRLGWSDPPIGESRDNINFFWAVDGDGNLLPGQWVDATGALYTGPMHEYPALSGVFWPSSQYDSVTNERLPGDRTVFYTIDINLVTAENIVVHPDIIRDAFNIAASDTQIVRGGAAEELQRGNNVNMNAIFALTHRRDFVLNVGGEVINAGGFDHFAGSIRFDIAAELNFGRAIADTANTLLLHASLQRESVSGVDMDEEMVNLVRYQHAFSGAARVITAMDELLDRLINGTGRVGL